MSFPFYFIQFIHFFIEFFLFSFSFPFFLDKPIDIEGVDLNTLRIKELKKVLSDFGGECVGCSEKSDYVKEIEKLKNLKKDL